MKANIKKIMTGGSLFRSRQLNLLLKFLLVALVAWALYKQVFSRDDLPQILENFQRELDLARWPIMVLVILMMPLNWILETIKWRILVNRIEQLSFWKAFRGILAGVSLSLFTPNRIGEYGGRILVVKPENNIKTVVVTLVGSFAQITVLLSMGGIGLSYFLYQHYASETLLLYATMICTGLGLGLLLLTYLNIDLLIPVFERIPFIKRGVRYMKVLKRYDTRDLLRVLCLSFLRYWCYSSQYFLLIVLLGVESSYLSGMSAIAVIYLLQTSIPLPPITGLLVRGRLAIEVWSYLGANELGVLSATFGLWAINILFPALWGLFFILRINLSNTLFKDASLKAE
ncbi:MAG: lysylphosphatidylglycerol synthase domain-containing protein [Bacteroidota bacterium]